jgi:hypothetical protein
VLSSLLLLFYVTVNAQKHQFAYESTENGLRNFNKMEQSPAKIKKRAEIRSSKARVAGNLNKEEVLKIAQKIVQSEGNVILYADYYFDSNNVLKERTKYCYDNNDNLIEYKNEVLNDNSRNWMQWREKWIISERYTQTFDSRNNIVEYKNWQLDYDNGQLNLVEKYEQNFDEMNRIVYHESYYWDDNYQMLIGNEKYLSKYDTAGYAVLSENYYWDFNRMSWAGDYKDVYEIDDNGCITNYELYQWNHETWDWFGQQKHTSTYIVDGQTVYEEQFFWSWDQTSKVWIKNLSDKHEYTYYIFNEFYWYEVRTAYYELINSEYVLMDETTRVPYPQGNSYLSALRKRRINDVLTDYLKMEYQYNANHKWTQVLSYVWMNEQWENYEYRFYAYATPDSVRTQINKRSAVYYQFNGLEVPDLCAGETLYPVSKNVTKYHPATGNEECYYAYKWETGLCNWIPNSNKRLTVYNASGDHVLSYTECDSYDQNDWYNCRNTQTIYNEVGDVTEKSEYQDGVLSNKYVYVYDNKGERVSSQYYEGENLVYRYDIDYNTHGRIIKQVYCYINQELPLGKRRYKWEVEYIADTIRSQINHFSGVDLNDDGLLDDEEWQYLGKEVYKYDAPLSGDSVHIVTQNYGDMEMIDLGTIKKLKITGPVRNSELYVINFSYRDSLRYLDLETAQIEFNTLREETFDETMLNTLILPNTLETIQEGAINDYEGFLEELTFYPSVVNFENGAIEAMGLRRVELPSVYFDKLYSFMFAEMELPGIVNVYRSRIEKLTFNDTQGKLPNEICYNLSYLKNVQIKDGITEIGENAFKSCGMLSSLKLPSTLTKIGYNAFWGCNELTELVIPEGATDIGYSAFWGCSGLSTIEMPSSLLAIGKNAFWGCSNVDRLRVAAIVPPALGENALAGIPRDAGLTIPAISVETYKSRDQWKEFYNINTGNNENTVELLKIAVSGRKLLLSDVPENAGLQIYHVSGLKIMDMAKPDQQLTIDLEPGVYVVKVGSGICKVVIR